MNISYFSYRRTVPDCTPPTEIMEFIGSNNHFSNEIFELYVLLTPEYRSILFESLRQEFGNRVWSFTPHNGNWLCIQFPIHQDEIENTALLITELEKRFRVWYERMTKILGNAWGKEITVEKIEPFRKEQAVA